MIVTLTLNPAVDSMLADIVWLLESGKSLEEAVQFGVACGTAVTIYAQPDVHHVHGITLNDETRNNEQ